MLRIASAWGSVSSQRAIISAFGDDADHLVEIDIDNDLPAQDLHAVADRSESMTALPLQHDPAMVEKGLQRLLQVHHLRHAERIEHIEVERHAYLELSQTKELLHQQLGIDIARLRLEHEADILGRLVLHVGKQRQLLLLEQGR